MKINHQTRISDIIRHDSRAIEAIASINPHFNKLRNPILRRVLAPRVTVKDAARIGGCTVEAFLAKLECIGFEIEEASPAPEVREKPRHDDRILSAIEEGRIEPMDVRPILESGTDPFQAIMERLRSLPEDHALEVINSFEPAPLIKLLGKKGYTSMVIAEGNAVHTWFLKTTPAEAEKPAAK